MSTIQVRSVGTYGFDVTPLSGIGLSTGDASTTRTRADDAQALANAIRQAMTTARNAGKDAFKPTDAQLTLPSGLTGVTNASRDQLFNTVIGRAYEGGPISLSDWSRAVDELEHWAGQQASMLPPAAGGGSRNVRGIWYVNGQSWSLSELFTVNRVNTLSEIDRMVGDSLNVIAANNQAAKSLTSLMKALFSRYYDMGPSDQAGKSQIDLDGQADASNPIAFEQLLAYADKYIGSSSMIRKSLSVSQNDAAPYDSTRNYALNDYVSYQGQLYRAVAFNTSTIAPYSSAASYDKWDTATYGTNSDGTSKLWQVVKEPLFGKLNNVAPGTTDNWRAVGAYDPAKKYGVDEVVSYNGSYYQLIKADKKPVFGDNYTLGIDPTNTTFWKPYAGPALKGATPSLTSSFWDDVPEAGLSKDDFRALIDEVETIVGAFGADNQVAQLRNETLFNSRSNLLEGLSTFLKGQQTTRSTLARNV